MTSLRFEKKKILIWGKTYPELSSQFLETVCTGGVTEEGTPIRLYPIPYRYLQGEEQFRKYQWITGLVSRNWTDPRPESHQIDFESIECGNVIAPDDREWDCRAEVMFKNESWQFRTMEELYASQQSCKTSIGVVEPREVLCVELFARPDEDEVSFGEKLNRLRRMVTADRKQQRLFCPGSA